MGVDDCCLISNKKYLLEFNLKLIESANDLKRHLTLINVMHQLASLTGP
jgi:hypothetical protein